MEIKQMGQKQTNPCIEKKRLFREIVFIGLFVLEFNGDVDRKLIETVENENFIRTKDKIVIDDDEMSSLVNKINAVHENQGYLDEIINGLLVGWKMDRIPLVVLNIIRMAAYDLLYVEDVPKNVTISEAVILADMYCDEKEKKFINGILSSVLKQADENKTAK